MKPNINKAILGVFSAASHAHRSSEPTVLGELISQLDIVIPSNPNDRDAIIYRKRLQMAEEMLKVGAIAPCVSLLQHMKYQAQRAVNTHELHAALARELQGFEVLDPIISQDSLYHARHSGCLSEYRLIEKDGKYGVIDKQHNVIIQPQYDKIEPLIFTHEDERRHVELILIWNGGKGGIMDKTGNAVVPLGYDEIKPFMNRRENIALILVRENSKWGIVDKDGNEVVPLKYDEIAPDESRIIIKQGKKWGALDMCGREVIQPQYDSLGEVWQDAIIAMQKGKYALLDKNGNALTPFQYDEMKNFDVDGGHVFICVKTGTKCGFINNHGQQVVRPDDYTIFFDYAPRFHDGYLGIKKGETWGYLDWYGNFMAGEVHPAEYREIRKKLEELREFAVEDTIKQVSVRGLIYEIEGITERPARPDPRLKLDLIPNPFTHGPSPTNRARVRSALSRSKWRSKMRNFCNDIRESKTETVYDYLTLTIARIEKGLKSEYSNDLSKSDFLHIKDVLMVFAEKAINHLIYTAAEFERSAPSQLEALTETESGPKIKSKLTIAVPEESKYKLLGSRFSPDGGKILFDRYLADSKTGNIVRKQDSVWSSVSLSPDGKKVAFSSSHDTPKGYPEFRVVDVESGKLIHKTPSLSNPYSSWSPDGARIARIDDNKLSLLDSATAQLLWSWHGAHLSDPVFAPNGKQIVVWDWNNSLFVLDANDGSVLAEKDLAPGNPKRMVYSEPRWSPDGTKIAIADQSDVLQVFRADTLSTLWTAKLNHFSASHYDLSPDGEKIAYGQGRKVCVRNMDGKILMEKAISRKVGRCKFFDGGKRLIVQTYDDLIRLMDAESGDILFRLPLENILDISRDGSQILSQNKDTLSIFAVE